MAPNQAAFTQINLTDIDNDVITDINGLSMPNLKATDLVHYFPGFFFIEKSEFGKPTLCCVRIDGTPLSIQAMHNQTSYTPPVSNFDWLYPLPFTAHPIHRPK